MDKNKWYFSAIRCSKERGCLETDTTVQEIKKKKGSKAGTCSGKTELWFRNSIQHSKKRACTMEFCYE